MRTETEIRALITEMLGTINVVAKRRLDRDRLRGSIAMVSALEWVLGDQSSSEALAALTLAECADAVKHANRRPLEEKV